jgi:type IV pilus assembly protein PilA
MKLNRSKKGFTLVEIMIVVVIIGLLAAMAIPAFSKVRKNANAKAVLNDARQIASAAQQLLMQNPSFPQNFVITYNANTGAIVSNVANMTSQIQDYVQKISKGYSAGPTYYNALSTGTTAAFVMNYGGLTSGDLGVTGGTDTDISFDSEGKPL